jgi:hypothetical protein
MIVAIDDDTLGTSTYGKLKGDNSMAEYLLSR